MYKARLFEEKALGGGVTDGQPPGE